MTKNNFILFVILILSGIVFGIILNLIIEFMKGG